MAYNIFISYSTKDLRYVEQIRSSIRGRDDIKVYIAQYSLLPGQSLSKEIQNAIDDCHLFLLLWSENAKDSEWVPQEIGIAKGKGKPILPVVLHSGLTLPGFINNLKYLNIHDKTEDQLAWLKNHIWQKAEEKSNNDNLVLFGLGAIVILALSK